MISNGLTISENSSWVPQGLALGSLLSLIFSRGITAVLNPPSHMEFWLIAGSEGSNPMEYLRDAWKLPLNVAVLTCNRARCNPVKPLEPSYIVTLAQAAKNGDFRDVMTADFKPLPRCFQGAWKKNIALYQLKRKVGHRCFRILLTLYKALVSSNLANTMEPWYLQLVMKLKTLGKLQNHQP